MSLYVQDRNDDLSLSLFSFSYRYDWLMEETEKNVLRTHTTAVSARMLYKLAQQVKHLL